MIKKTIERTVIKADPGWFVAVFVKEGEHQGETWDAYFALDPIIAWEIERREGEYHPSAKQFGEPCISHEVTPITIEGNTRHCTNDWAIKRPDGRFDIPYDRSFEFERDVIAYFSERKSLVRTAATP
jgi:hypothetical protein